MSSYYESDRAVAEYLLFHYGPDPVQMPWPGGPLAALGFPARCIRETFLQDAWPSNARALDLGCAVGRSSFELSAACREVVGIDASQALIAAAKRLQSSGSVEFDIRQEGSVSHRTRVTCPAGSRPDRVVFEVGDALHPRADLGAFDLVLAANLLDRVPSPRQFLQVVRTRVAPGGQLVITSPYTWLEEYTPREEWLSSPEEPTVEVLARHLPGFRLARRLDLPFLIREHARKFQWSVAEATVWIAPSGDTLTQ
jgi:putative 4-mercaptohistidine N1-methyltranferase